MNKLLWVKEADKKWIGRRLANVLLATYNLS